MRAMRTYRMTISSTWYDKTASVQREFEMHFRIARRGNTRYVRHRLVKRGLPYFQRHLYRRYKRWITKRRIRVSFERGEHATKVERYITIEIRGMRYRGKEWKATRLPSRSLSYVKKKRKHKSA